MSVDEREREEKDDNRVKRRRERDDNRVGRERIESKMITV